MQDKYVVEVNYGDNNFNLEEIKRINKNIEEISKHPFPGDLHGKVSGFGVINEYANESAIELMTKDDSLNLKYRRIQIKGSPLGRIYVLEDWIGSNTSIHADKKKILWGRREYTEK